MCLLSPEVAFQGGLGGDQGSSHPPDGFGEPNPGAATPAEDGKLWDNTHGAVDVELGFFYFFLSSNCCCYFNTARHFLDDWRGP